jgi:hypothetical protein
MRQQSQWPLPMGLAVIVSVSALSFVASAQKPPQPLANQGTETFLIRQDSADCNNANVNADNPSLIGGSAWVIREPNGVTTVKVAITGTPNTIYNLYHKCVGQIGIIITQDEGEGSGVFQFLSQPGPLAFDMYPNGAPSGNKFQSVPIVVQ